ncbi:MAG: patatin-like phospholipase family protein [Oscillospiraceae bacterium]|nr:patatin-like phospholipase family protein [Oscillospiraceae bacterium]
MAANSQKKPIGLALCGGGAKGAFQAGALEVLYKRGVLSEVKAVAGCSVGALNMALYAIACANGNIELLENIWKQIQREDLLSVGTSGTAIFSRQGMIRLLHLLPLELVSSSPLQLFASVWNVTESRVEFYQLNGLPNDAIRTLLMASSAIPAAYDPVQYNGDVFMDGGMVQTGNLCIEPLHDIGCRDIMIVAHDSEMYLDGVQNVKLVRGFGKVNLHTVYPDCTLMLLKPNKSLGGLLRGTLNFSSERIEERLSQGRLCAANYLEAYDDGNERLISEMARILPNGVAFTRFLECCDADFIPNLPVKTMEGKLWYNDIFERDGWRVQQHRVKGLDGHYRILDPDGVRRAWVLNAERMQQALTHFEANANIYAPRRQSDDVLEQILTLGKSGLSKEKILERASALLKDFRALRDEPDD